MAKKTIHTCYGCPYYYRLNTDGEKEYLQPHSYRHCEIKNPWNCDYFTNDGEPQKIIKHTVEEV